MPIFGNAFSESVLISFILMGLFGRTLSDLDLRVNNSLEKVNANSGNFVASKYYTFWIHLLLIYFFEYMGYFTRKGS